MKIFKNYGLSIALCTLFLLSWGGQAYFQWNEFVATQKEHNVKVQISDYFNEFASATLENWQSEFLQLFTFVVLATYLIHKGSPQSRDGSDKMMKMVQDIQKKVNKSAGKN